MIKCNFIKLTICSGTTLTHISNFSIDEIFYWWCFHYLLMRHLFLVGNHIFDAVCCTLPNCCWLSNLSWCTSSFPDNDFQLFSFVLIWSNYSFIKELDEIFPVLFYDFIDPSNATFAEDSVCVSPETPDNRGSTRYRAFV